MKIPSDNRWTQLNQGQLLGVLNDSYQMNYDQTGFATGSKKSCAIMSSDTDANYAYTMAGVYFSGGYYAVTTDAIFLVPLSGAAPSEETTFTPSTTLSSDALVFEDNGGTDQLLVTLDDNFARWNGSASVSYTLGSLTSGVPHPLCVFESQTTDKLAIGNGNQVNVYTNAFAAGSTNLVLPTEYQVTTLAYRNGYLYVGTKNIYGGEAKIFVWNGATANADYDIPVGGSWVFSLTPYLNNVAAIVDSGTLMTVSGNSYSVLARLPVYDDPNAVWQGSTGLSLNGKVFHRGMQAVGNNLYINIDGTTETGNVPQMKSGLWIYDPDVGLYHAASSGSDNYVRDTGLSVTSSVITTSAAHNLKTGDAVQFQTVSGLSGVDDGVPYYVNVESTTTIKLAKTRKALQAGRYVAITGTAGVGDVLLYCPNTDRAGARDATSGAVMVISPEESPIEMWSYPVLWGARSDKPDNTAFYGLYTLTDSWNISRFCTQRIYTNNITQTYQTLANYFNKLGVSGEEMIVKYKSDDGYGYPTKTLQGVWLEANKINSTNTLDEDEWGDISIGDEVTIVDGTGRGYTAHVTNKSETGGNTTTLTLDESIGTANDDVYIRVDNFKKVQSITQDRERRGMSVVGLDSPKSSYIQLKVELRGFQTEFVMFDLINKVDKLVA